MKTYAYASVAYQGKDVLLARVTEHRELIDAYAAKGYRYAGMIPTELSANGCIRKIDLIFEKEV